MTAIRSLRNIAERGNCWASPDSGNERFYLPWVEKFALSTAANTSGPCRQTAWNLEWMLYFECLLPWQGRKSHIKPAKLPGGGTA